MTNVADDAFGRFLENQMNSWREIGVEAERERIIKLLEEAKPLQATDELEWGIEQAIALIKGENK